jgi:hypothetical protein
VTLGILEEARAIGARETADGLFGPGHPPGTCGRQGLEPRPDVVFTVEAVHEHVELEPSHGADDRDGSAERLREQKEDGAFLGEMAKSLVQMLAPERVLDANERELLG